MNERKMQDREESIRTLVGLGISGTQAKTYLALSEIGTSTIRVISEASGVGRPDTYRAVVELEGNGLVETVVSTPTKYKPLPLPEAISILIGHREMESLELQEKSAKLIKEYEKKTVDTTNIGDNEFVLIPKRDALLNRMTRLVENSQKSVNVMVSQKTLLRFFDHCVRTFEKAMAREVNIKIVTEKHGNNLLRKRLLRLKKREHLEIRYLTILAPITLAIFDNKQILLSTQAQTVNEHAAAVLSNNTSFIELSQNYFNNAWSSAIEPLSLEFRRTKLQFDYLFANLINGFAYCKLIFDDENRPSDFVYLQVNDAFERIVGLKRSQVIGKRVSEAIPGFEEQNPELFEMFSRVCRSGKGEDREIFLKPLNRWRQMSVYSPKKGYFAVIFDDITERKKTEAALKQSEERLRSTLDDMIEGCQIIGNDWRYLYINDAAERHNRRSKEELLGNRYMDMWPAIQSTNVFAAIKRCMDKRIPKRMENKFNFPDGTSGWFELRIMPVPEGIFISSIDITERKRAELEMQEKYEVLEKVAENVGGGLAIIGKDYNVVWANHTLTSLGVSSDKKCYQTFNNLETVCPDCGAKKVFEQNAAFDAHEYRTVNNKGEVIWIELRVTPLKDKDGNITAALELAVPITEHKRAEIELETMNEFLKTANTNNSTRDLIEATLDFFQKQSGCEAVGIRLKEGEDYPYYETRGFPPEHVLLENKLCAIDEAGCLIRDFKGDPIVECMCRNVIFGRFDPSKKFFTEKGSFWANDTTRLIATTTDADRQTKTRNRCNGEGYESVALLALRAGENRLGLLQLNDKRKNMFTLETIQMWERIANHLALALSRTIAEESLKTTLVPDHFAD